MGLIERIKDLAGEALAAGATDAWTVLDRLAMSVAEGTAGSLALTVSEHAPEPGEALVRRLADVVFAHGEAEEEAPGVLAGLQTRWHYWCGPYNVQVVLSDEGHALSMRVIAGRIRVLYIGVESRPGRPLHWWEGGPARLEDVLRDIAERHNGVARHVKFDAVA